MNELLVTIDLSAPEPPYEQVRAQLAGLIGRGSLAEGDRLPTVRALAADLGLAVNTVARAYKELEAEGLVTTRREAQTIFYRIANENAQRLLILLKDIYCR